MAVSALLGGCAQLTGTDEVTLEGDPITGDDGPASVAAAPPTKSFGCAYPIVDPSMIGVAEGMTVPVTHGWEGYVAGEEGPRRFELAEAYDCTGKEVHAIGIDTSQFG